MATDCLPYFNLQFLDDSGNPLNAGKVYVYAAGTTNPATTFSDDGSENPWPVVLDVGGRAQIRGVSGFSYKFIVKTSAGVQVGEPMDNIEIPGGAVSSATFDYIQINTTATPVASVEGLLQWNQLEHCLDVGLFGGSVGQIPFEELTLVWNNTGSTITNGTPVYCNGTSGQRISVAPIGAASSNAYRFFGLATQDIATNSLGIVARGGRVRDLNTNAWNEGDSVWLSATTGQLTNSAPAKPNHQVRVGTVEKKSGGAGIILLDIVYFPELGELSNVSISSITNGQGLQWNSSTGLFERGGPWLPLAGGTLTGLLNGTSAVFSGSVQGDSLSASYVSTTGAVTNNFGPGPSIQIYPVGFDAGQIKFFTNGTETDSIRQIDSRIGFFTYEGGFFRAPIDETGNKTIATREWVGGQFTAANGVKAETSSGLLLEASNGTDIGLLGASDSANIDWYGIHYHSNRIAVTRAAANNTTIVTQVTGDSVERYAKYADGKQEWGSGSATRDTNLYRNAADSLATDDNFQGPRCRLTPDGGFAILMNAGENLVKGEVVAIDSAADNSVVKCPADAYDPIGFVYENATSGNGVWIVTSGRAQALLQDSTTSTRDYWVRTSTTTAGRVDITNATPPGGTVAALEIHSKECGHCMETKSAGTNVLAWVVVHFN